MGKYFGTDGFRGEANVRLTCDHAYRIGRFLGWYFGARMGRKARVVLGKDTRRSSYMFEYSITAGLTCSGADVYMLHVITTPGVAYVTCADSFDCGIMISASHNHYRDNGIKLINRRGEKMNDETVSAIEDYLDGKNHNQEIPSATGEALGSITDYVSGRNRYIAHLISLATHSFKSLRIGLDCANGSAWNIAPAVFNTLGAKLYLINSEPDGLNINRSAGSTHPDSLRRLVLENRLDMGFAYDGDADRCIAVDENGDIVDGDKIMYILARAMQKQEKLAGNTVVTTIMSNMGLHRALAASGIACEKTAVGDRYVYERMQQGGCTLGGEQSGHIILGKYATTGDGILTSIMLTEAMLDSKSPLSLLCADVKAYPQVHMDVRVADAAAVLADEFVRHAVRTAENRLGNSGRIIIRKSGTEPVIRIMAEAEDRHAAEECANGILTAIKKVTSA